MGAISRDDASECSEVDDIRGYQFSQEILREELEIILD